MPQPIRITLRVLAELAIAIAMVAIAAPLWLIIGAAMVEVPWMNTWSGWPPMILNLAISIAIAAAILAMVFRGVRLVVRALAERRAKTGSSIHKLETNP